MRPKASMDGPTRTTRCDPTPHPKWDQNRNRAPKRGCSPSIARDPPGRDPSGPRGRHRDAPGLPPQKSRVLESARRRLCRAQRSGHEASSLLARMKQSPDRRFERPPPSVHQPSRSPSWHRRHTHGHDSRVRAHRARPREVRLPARDGPPRAHQRAPASPRSRTVRPRRYEGNQSRA